MRNLIFAFGLIFFPAVTMAAPSNPTHCKITSSASSFVTTNCTVAERKLINAAQTKPTTKQINKTLKQLTNKEYLVINTLCKLKGGRRKAPRRLVERCYRRAGEGQRLILRNSLVNLQHIKACKGIKTLGKQVNCMIDQNNKVLLPLIERTLDAHETYIKGLKFMIERGCTFNGSKLKCAGPTPCGESRELCASVDWHKGSGIGLFLSFIFSLLTSRRRTREDWYEFEALGHVETRNAIWAVEDELYRARYIERAIEVAITAMAFSVGGLIMGVASALLAHKRYGWASIFALFISVLLWGSALEWVLFVIKATMSFLANTDEGFHFVKWVLHQRWKRQVAKLK